MADQTIRVMQLVPLLNPVAQVQVVEQLIQPEAPRPVQEARLHMENHPALQAALAVLQPGQAAQAQVVAQLNLPEAPHPVQADQLQVASLLTALVAQPVVADHPLNLQQGLAAHAQQVDQHI